MTNLVKKMLSKADLKAISDAIGALEQRTSGEVRVSIRQNRSRREQGLAVEKLAHEEFAQLGMANTKERNGVLLFLLLEARELHIFADEHIHSKVDPAVWQGIADSMVARFKRNEYTEGTLEAIKAIGNILSEHYPRKPDDVNELPNEIVIR